MNDYVTFTSTSIKVDLARFLKTDEGKELLKRIDHDSKRFERDATEIEMGRRHGEVLQQIGSALGLLPGADIHKECVPAIEKLRRAAAQRQPTNQIALDNGWKALVKYDRVIINKEDFARAVAAVALSIRNSTDVMEIAALRATIESQQAQIDELMLEYCPAEMTQEQMRNWAEHQKRASPEEEAAINNALGLPTNES